MATMQVQNETISDELLKQPQDAAQVTLHNLTLAAMTLNRSMNWSGGPTGGSFPPSIPANGSTNFIHLKGANSGSKAAVVYTGRNASNAPCAWVLAWDAPPRTTVSPNKVFVACGPTSVIDALDFNQILRNLDSSTAEANATYPSSKTSAYAIIHHLIPNTAFVGTDFKLMP